MMKKHRKTIAPAECAHCGLIWYGIIGKHSEAPERTLCTRCYNALTNYLWDRHNDDFYCLRSSDVTDGLCRAVYDDASAWIQDRGKKPLPRHSERRFHSSVPRWMRSAIREGMVKTNGNEVYIVYSEGDIAIKVETLPKSL